MAALLRSRQGSAPDMGDVTALAPGEPGQLFPPLALALAGFLITGAARIDGRATRDSLLLRGRRPRAAGCPGTPPLSRPEAG